MDTRQPELVAGAVADVLATRLLDDATMERYRELRRLWQEKLQEVWESCPSHSLDAEVARLNREFQADVRQLIESVLRSEGRTPA